MDQEKFKKINYELIETFLSAGKLCLDLRKEGLTEELKKDSTPVTNGDLEVNKILVEKISKLTPDIPIVSEESSLNKKNLNLNDFWLIDPIDGTYDYINDGEEFTLNAGLIINKKSVMGIIFAPAKNRLFYTYGKNNSFMIEGNKTVKLSCKKNNPKGKILAVSGTSKPPQLILDVLKKYNVSSFTPMHSSYKFCVIATGEFDFYAAKERAYEWDYAAGHAVAENAGAIITTLENEPFKYGKEDYKNLSLIIKRSEVLDD